MTGSYEAAMLLLLGLFLAGGVYSFAHQGMPKGVTILIGLCAVMAIAGGILRWNG